MKKKLKYLAAAILSIHLLSPVAVKGQVEVRYDSVEAKLIKSAREIITATGICTLITLDEDGMARARAMDAFLPDDDFNIWFATNPGSRKVKQIQHDPRVTLYYFDKETFSYVVIYGSAQLIDDAGAKKEHWKKEWQAFYPNYPDGFLLIKVIPEQMEVLSEVRGISSDSLTWQPPVVKFDHR
jgi:general stress protein 26